jgi:SAM-dependent methyltransferase
MFDKSAELYDLIYTSFKDYAGETAQIADVLRQLHPSCSTVLDVACGTGEHARHLAVEHGFLVDGLDLDAALLTIARRKHPGGRFFMADMGEFHLPHRYDAITCLFSSIGYLCTLNRVRGALRCFREHLASNGVIVIEPWFAPGVLQPGHVEQRTAEGAGVRVERTSHTEIEGRISRLHLDYRVTGPDGVRQSVEIHELGLFTTEEMLEMFRQSKLHADYDPYGLTGRGLYVARTAA